MPLKLIIFLLFLAGVFSGHFLLKVLGLGFLKQYIQM